jgi:hypothetical protein
MKQNKKPLLLSFVSIFLFLFFLNLVVAQGSPPVFVSEGTDDFELKVPVISTLRQHQVYEFEVHVYNKSNGVPIISGISCYFHLYNSTGNHLLEMEDTTASHTFDYSFPVTGRNFSELGHFPFVIQCNSSTQGGFWDSSIEVTPTGVENLYFYLIILIVSAIIIMFGFAIKDEWITILGTFGLYFVGLYTLINGIDIVKNTTYTYAISLILIGLATYISYKAAREAID